MVDFKEEYNFNNSYALQNAQLLDYYKSQYPNLAPITCQNNILSFNNQSFQLGYFRLNQITVMILELEAKDFFNTIKLLASVEHNLENEDFYLMNINIMLESKSLTAEERNIINKFVDDYIDLKNHEDYLAGTPTITLSKYRQIVNKVLYLSDPANLSEAQKIIFEKMNTVNSSIEGRGNSYTRVLKNANFPNMVPDEEQGYSKAGFASILLILYTIINAAIILAISVLK